MKLTRIRSAITNVLLKEMENINNKITLSTIQEQQPCLQKK